MSTSPNPTSEIASETTSSPPHRRAPSTTATLESDRVTLSRWAQCPMGQRRRWTSRCRWSCSLVTRGCHPVTSSTPRKTAMRAMRVPITHKRTLVRVPRMQGVPIELNARGLPRKQHARRQGWMLRTASVTHSTSFHVAAIAVVGEGQALASHRRSRLCSVPLWKKYQRLFRPRNATLS
jgi:hypothetical protein